MTTPFLTLLLRRAGTIGLCTACAAGAAQPEPTPLALAADFAKADATHASVADVLHLGDKITLPVRIETTTQGNGTLTLANLTLRLQDRHDDGIVYAGDGVLRLDVVKLSAGAHLPALVVSGTALHTGDKASDPSVPEAVLYIYEADCAAGRLVRVWRNTRIDIELDTNAGGTLRCAR